MIRTHSRVFRECLPDTRKSLTKKIRVGSAKVYVTAGFYEDDRLGEIFLRLDELSAVSPPGAAIEEVCAALTEQVTDLSVAVARILDALATSVSKGLQYGIPLEEFSRKFEHTNFEPRGFSEDGPASSPLDAVFRFLRLRYGEDAPRPEAPAAGSIEEMEADHREKKRAFLLAEARVRAAREASEEARIALGVAHHRLAQARDDERK